MNSCFIMGSEGLTYLNQMIFIDFGRSAGYGGLERLHDITVVLIDFSLDYASYVIVQWVEV